MTSRIRTYTEMLQRDGLEDRFRYLALHGEVGSSTFGFDRYINQKFYTSREWKHIRNLVISRDQGCDLAVEGYEIHTKLIIHHLNPMTANDIEQSDGMILDPEYLITTTLRTHNAIHYGDERLLPKAFVGRSPGDTKVW